MTNRIEGRLSRLEERVAPSDSEYPEAIELVPVHRLDDGSLAHGKSVIIWKRQVDNDVEGGIHGPTENG